MKKTLITRALAALSLGAGSILAATSAGAQTPQPADWTVLTFHADIAKPAYVAWQKVGGDDLCAIAKYLEVKGCTPISGRGEVGSLRNIALANGSVVEIIVARTSYSYTYAQPFTPIFYHGTMTMEAVDATHSRLVYTLIWNQAAVGDKAAQAAALDGRKVRFQAAVDKMAAAANAP